MTPPLAGDGWDAESATAPYRVRFDECGPGGAARASAYLRYAQDVAWIHSERLGFDRAWYDARSVIWVVRAISLDILAPSVTADVLSVRTRVLGFRRVWARRETDMRRPDGSLVALARTDWVMIDLRGMPTRVPEAITSRFHAPPGSGPLEPIRLVRASTPADASGIGLRVRPQEVDPQEHVNNAVWIDWVDEGIARAAGEPPAGPRRYVLEYVASATLGAYLVVSAWPHGDGFECAIRERSAVDGQLADRLRAHVAPLPYPERWVSR
jgi:acyl-CoA thioesterase FadM